MKPLILPFLVVMVMLLLVAWMNRKYAGVGPLYFEPNIVLGIGKTGLVNLMKNGIELGEFKAEFLYDPKAVKIEEIALNNDIFSKLIENNIDQVAGKVIIRGVVTTPEKGIQKLAIIKVRALKTLDKNIISNFKFPISNKQ